ncbi:MAG: L,D-transpeptidase [Xanthobacteraceae bacterium]|nr:L,D-transpeptidase [Xanthobacteraceae bacterium]
MHPATQLRRAIPALAALFLSIAAAQAQPLFLNDPNPFAFPIFRDAMRDPVAREPVPQTVPDIDADAPAAAVPERFQRQTVAYNTTEAPGTVIIDTPNTYLYYVLGNGRAIRYGIGVGREGFTWAGVQSVARKQEWPDWHPPAEMIARQPYLPRFMAGGPGNPLGARAMYLGNSLYRIHGTNAPSTIGQRVSSGCIRLTNENVIDLFNRVQVGAKVVVLPDRGHRMPVASAAPRVPVRAAQRDVRPQTPQAQAPEPAAASETPLPRRLPGYQQSSIYTGASTSFLY